MGQGFAEKLQVHISPTEFVQCTLQRDWDFTLKFLNHAFIFLQFLLSRDLRTGMYERIPVILDAISCRWWMETHQVELKRQPLQFLCEQWKNKSCGGWKNS